MKMLEIKHQLPDWAKFESVNELAQDCFGKLDNNFPVVVGEDKHHYRKTRNLKTFILKWMTRAYRLGLKDQIK